jgi:polyisoprenoid-binding protein YceI
VTATTPGIRPRPAEGPALAAGHWEVDPARSRASFAARVAGHSVRGCLPLTGKALITEPIEESTARLAATTSAIRTGSTALDRLLAGPAFLDARAFPQISFRSELLVWVPAGWRAVGRLQVKNVEHELACQLELRPGDRAPDGQPRLVITSQWVIDSRWITSQWIPGLSRRVVIMCSFGLEPSR